MVKENFVKMYETSIKDNWSLPAITNYNSGTSYSYSELGQRIMTIHLALERLGIAQGDKVALIAKDSAEWCAVWLGIVTYGAVVVPILPTFHPNDILHIIDHSDSRVLFVGDEHRKFIKIEALPKIEATLDVMSQKVLPELCRSTEAKALDPAQLFEEKYSGGFTKKDVAFPEISNNELGVINYTSGTTGFSKGVLLTLNNLAANVVFANRQGIFFPGGRILSFLPNAHAYSCAFNFLSPLAKGTHIYILGQKPVGSVLLKACKEVRPHTLISVPLIMEKIYKGVIQPKISKPSAKIALAIPGVNKIIYRKIGKTLMETLGGELNLFVIGGAAFNEEVDLFLKKTGFPYIVGYGLTECAPLVGYVDVKEYVPRSSGKGLDKDLVQIRLFEPEEENGKMVGELQVLGEVVCKGYYKNAEETEKLFTADGWMRTGDLAHLDNKGNIFLVGRSKSILLNSSGENVHPEHIEAKIAMLPYMQEAILVQRDNNKLVGIVTVDHAAIARDKKDLDQVLAENLKALNEMIAVHERVAAFEVLEGEFEKTPKESIKRFLYK
ncbi:MAG: AMP-binding protein [Porphyromonas sp.]|nr:AMP-binding protein [Porphyromonas sp.]